MILSVLGFYQSSHRERFYVIMLKNGDKINNLYADWNLHWGKQGEKADAVKATIQALVTVAANQAVQTKIFGGQTLPPFPADDEFRNDGTKFLIGRHLNYDTNNFFVELSDKPEQNLLFCDKTQIFFDCALKFADVTNHFSERVFPKLPFSPKPQDVEFTKFWRELSEHGSHILERVGKVQK